MLSRNDHARVALALSYFVVACGGQPANPNTPIKVQTPGGTTGGSSGGSTGTGTTGRGTSGGSTGGGSSTSSGSSGGSTGGTTGGGTTSGSTGGGTNSTGGTSGGGTTGGTTGLGFNDARVIDLGVQTFTNGASPTLSVALGADDESFMVVAYSTGAVASTTGFFVSELRNPSGTILTTGDDPFTHKNRSSAMFGAHAMMAPQTPDIDSQVGPGTYTFKVYAFDGFTGDAEDGPIGRVVALVKRRVTAPRRKLNINFFFTNSASLSAATAPTTKRFTDALAVMRNVYATANVDIDQISYIDIGENYQEVRGMVPGQFSTGVSMAEVQRRSAGALPALNFFFVEYLIASDANEAGRLLGVAGGIPGPAGFNGSDRSGVIVLYDTNTWSRGADPLGITMAHEGGHFLGLWHIGEIDQQSGQLGSARDNLSDTGTNETNLMYPYANPAGGLLTPMQGQVMRRNPLVRQ